MSEPIAFCRGCGSVYPESEKARHRICLIGLDKAASAAAVKRVEIEPAGAALEESLTTESVRDSDARKRFTGADGKFDRKAYQRDLMRRRRALAKAKKERRDV